jgi:predicted RNA-binding Zn-ribbon protein involved in translation (DUF1610 family)
MEDKKCISCKRKIENIKGSAVFKCPNCGEYEIIRCRDCRVTAVKYKCPSCEFEGPN